MSKAGNFEIDVWRDGYPVWCVIRHGGKEIRVRHSELADLQYAVTRAMKEARAALPEQYKEEV